MASVASVSPIVNRDGVSSAAARPVAPAVPATTRIVKRALDSADRDDGSVKLINAMSFAPVSASAGFRMNPREFFALAVAPTEVTLPVIRVDLFEDSEEGSSDDSDTEGAAALPPSPPLSSVGPSAAADLAAQPVRALPSALTLLTVPPIRSSMPSAAQPLMALQPIPNQQEAAILLPRVFSAYNNLSPEISDMFDGVGLSDWGVGSLPPEVLRWAVHANAWLRAAEQGARADGINNVARIVQSGMLDQCPGIKQDFTSRLFLQHALGGFPMRNRMLIFVASPPVAALQQAMHVLSLSESGCQNGYAPVHIFESYQSDMQGGVLGNMRFEQNISLMMRKSLIMLLQTYCYLEIPPQPTTPLQQCGAHSAFQRLSQVESSLRILQGINSQTVQLWVAQFSEGVQLMRREIAKRLHPGPCHAV